MKSIFYSLTPENHKEGLKKLFADPSMIDKGTKIAKNYIEKIFLEIMGILGFVH